MPTDCLTVSPEENAALGSHSNSINDASESARYDTLGLCWFNAGPASATLIQHWTDTEKTPEVFSGTIHVSTRNKRTVLWDTREWNRIILWSFLAIPNRRYWDVARLMSSLCLRWCCNVTPTLVHEYNSTSPWSKLITCIQINASRCCFAKRFHYALPNHANTTY